MKCPKCQYISFDSPERCRNCGYDFALAPGPARRQVDPALRTAAEDGPMPDLEIDQPAAVELPASRTRGRHDSLDLPLFDEPVPGLDDTPLISTPSAPRAPLSVRRGTPEPSRIPRPPRSRGQRPDPPTREPGGAVPTPQPGRPERRVAEPTPVASAEDAPPLVLNLVVIHFTLAILRYPWSRLLELPLLPLAAFCLLLDVGYVVAFHVASGQTIGKMVGRIRVVTDVSWRVPVNQAVLRAALAPLSILTLGLGYLPALVGSDRRALHDRLSNTRVVRA